MRGEEGAPGIEPCLADVNIVLIEGSGELVNDRDEVGVEARAQDAAGRR